MKSSLTSLGDGRHAGELGLGAALLGAAPSLLPETGSGGCGLLGLSPALLLADDVPQELALHDGALALHVEELLVGGLLDHWGSSLAAW